MPVILKNVSEITRTYAGQAIIASGQYSVLESEIIAFRSDSNLLADIALGHACINNGLDDIATAGAQLNFLLGIDVSPKDSDGAGIVRFKTTRAGWHFEPRSIDFTTGVNSSMYNRRHNGNTISEGTDYGDATLVCYDASGVAITQNGETLAEWQARLDAQCVRTEMDWQPVYDMDIIGGSVSVLAAPESPHEAYMWIIGACDIPEEYGGSVPFLAGGYNCKHFKATPILSLDGRGVYALSYDPINNSNKIRVVLKHTVGCQIQLQFLVDHFKA